MPPRDQLNQPPISLANPTLDPIEDITRRRLLTALPTVSLMAAGLSCGDDKDAPAETPSTEWRFTDDRGVTITLPKAPARIVVIRDLVPALWDFGLRPVGVFGWTRQDDGTPYDFLGSVDLDAMVEIGGWEQFDVEKLIASAPDLIVTAMYPDLDLSQASQEVVEKIAPIAGIDFTGAPLNRVIEKLETMAGVLGADLTAAEVVEDREGFARAGEALRQAIADKPDLTALFISAHDPEIYVANPAQFDDLLYYRELGLNIVVPGVAPDQVWETLSWEQATKYPADLVLEDRYGVSLRQLNEQPTWALHPAQQAGQVHIWPGGYPLTYKGATPVLKELAEIIRNSRDDVV